MSAKNWGMLAILSLLWGGSFFFVEIALTGLPTLSIVWSRVALAAGLLGLALLVSGTALPRGVPVWRAFLVMGILNNVFPFTLFVLAQGQISGSLAAILNATTPLWGVVMAHLFTSDDKITPTKALGLALGFVGVVVMMGGTLRGDAWASLACLAAAFCYGIAGVFARRFRAMAVPPLATAFGQLTCSTLLILPVWLWLDQPWTMAMPGLRVIGAVVGISALSTALASLIFFRVLAEAGSTNVQLVTFLIPVSASLLGVLLLNEVVTAQQIAGFGLIALGLAAIDGRVWRW